MFTLSPDQKGIETRNLAGRQQESKFTLSPDQKGIETKSVFPSGPGSIVHTEPRSKGD